MTSTSSTLVRTRRMSPTYMATAESNRALKLLLEARNDENISPLPVIAPSACQLLIRNHWLPGRASYMLQMLVESKVIARVEHSHKYLILRPDLYITDFPEPAPQAPKPAVPTPKDLAPRFVAARENSDLVLLKRKLEQATKLADTVGQTLEKVQKENGRLQGELTHLKDQRSGADDEIARIQSEADALVAAADTRANEASSRALTAQANLDTALQHLRAYKAWAAEVGELMGMFPTMPEI